MSLGSGFFYGMGAAPLECTATEKDYHRRTPVRLKKLAESIQRLSLALLSARWLPRYLGCKKYNMYRVIKFRNVVTLTDRLYARRSAGRRESPGYGLKRF